MFRGNPAGMSDPSTTSKLRATNTILALVVLILAGQVAWQVMRISSLKAELMQVQLQLANDVERLALDKLTGKREELVQVVQWLDEFYRSADGLQRPSGLWLPEANRPDGEAIGVWVLDVYLQARIGGASTDEARQAVIDSIKATDEWRRKHPKA
jgi:hypothetical protein